ncbi:MAG: anaerobic C4-dicarboxylate transporter [Desulfovibrio sp.]|jgi:anaerobic C4-dicarboxylate transporter DcuA|nr:anaerobic C4-dicarboxylate transporter [Desulfovibrio sp.]
MIFLELIVVLGAIFLGARMGSIGIGFAGGLGVLVLGLLGVKPGAIPIDVILIIMSVISAIATMEVAGGLKFLVNVAERLLRKNPKRITMYAPLVTYGMTLMAGTGHTAFSTLPVIAEVAKEQGIRPSRPLSIAVVASQVAITASPISAAVVYLSSALEPLHVDYLQILLVCVPTSLAAVIIASFVTNFLGKELKDDPICQERLAHGIQRRKTDNIKMDGAMQTEILPGAKTSVWIFAAAILMVMVYATMISDKVGLIAKEHIVLSRDSAIMSFMLTAASLMVLACRLNPSKVLNASTFKSGMSACICVLGVAWLGTTFVTAHEAEIKEFAGGLLQSKPWLLSVALFFASMLLYSQAATAKALVPTAIALGVSGGSIVASFAAVSALFVLPTYPTLLAAVEMDDTGSTRIGKYVFDHPFIIPGVLTIALSVLFGFILSGLVL